MACVDQAHGQIPTSSGVLLGPRALLFWCRVPRAAELSSAPAATGITALLLQLGEEKTIALSTRVVVLVPCPDGTLSHFLPLLPLGSSLTL